AAQPIALVEDHDVDPAGLDVLHQPLERWPFQRSTRQATVIIFVLQQRPAFGRLAEYIGGAGLALGMERVEVLLETLLARFPRVDRAADLLHAAVLRCLRPKKAGPDQRVPV